MMTGLQGLAFMNHADTASEMEPLWKGLLPWVVVLSFVAGLSALVG